MSNTCPYCPPEPNETQSGWGMSHGGWEEMKRIHDEHHVIKCSCCGQPTGIKPMEIKIEENEEQDL